MKNVLRQLTLQAHSPGSGDLWKTFRTSPKFRRLELLLKNEIPTRSEINHFAGPTLAEVFCDFGHPDIKKCLEVTSPLRGPPDELWISPSDQLIGRVSLKPPPKQDCMKACTHEGILELGEQGKRQWEAETEQKLRLGLTKSLQEIRLICEAEKRHAISLCLKNLQHKHEKDIALLSQEYEQILEVVRAEAVAECNKRQQKAVVQERMSVTHEMLKKLRDEIGYVVIDLHDEFERKHLVQRENLIADFNRIMRHERAKVENRMTAIQLQKAEDMAYLRTQLDSEHKAAMINIAHFERVHCKAQKHSLQQCCKKKIEALEELLLDTKNNIELLKEEKEKLISLTPECVWKEKIREIIQQFQKFINFAFKAVPGQAEFLLSLESLLRLELDKNIPGNESREQRTIMKQKAFSKPLPGREAFRVVEIIDKEGQKWRPIQLIPEVPQLYCTEEQLVSPIVKSEISCQDNDKDTKTSSSSSCSTLDKLYVRADYRPGEGPEVMKTMEELADGGRFVMQLNDFSPCNILLKDIKDDPLSLEDKKEKSCNCNNVQKASTSFKVIGESDIEHHQQTPEEFVCSRVKSLNQILGFYPSFQSLLTQNINPESKNK